MKLRLKARYVLNDDQLVDLRPLRLHSAFIGDLLIKYVFGVFAPIGEAIRRGAARIRERRLARARRSRTDAVNQ